MVDEARVQAGLRGVELEIVEARFPILPGAPSHARLTTGR
jgi:hypothetical protein